jgi:hypothetical protein
MRIGFYPINRRDLVWPQLWRIVAIRATGYPFLPGNVASRLAGGWHHRRGNFG